MEDRDKIAYLHELAASHFNDGNLSAAIAAWEQVLQVDKANQDAQKGIQLARRKLAVASDIARHEAAVADESPFGEAEPEAAPAGGPFDADATMMFNATAGPNPATSPAPYNPEATVSFRPPASPAARPAPPAEADEERTMLFNPAAVAATRPSSPSTTSRQSAPPVADEERTMLFNPAAVATPPPAPDFDADRTMVFNAAATPAAKPSSPPAGPAFDAERTMLFNPAATPAAPATPPPDFDADRTLVFNAPSAAPPAAAPAPAPARAPVPPPPAADEDRTLVFNAASASTSTPWGASPDAATPGFDLGGPSASSWAPAAPEPDAESTVLSQDAFAPRAAEPAVAAADEADRTVMSSDAPQAAPPPPPSSWEPTPPKVAPAAPLRDLEDFVLPTGGLELAGPPPAAAPPATGKAGAPPSDPGGFGFSFELPPPPPPGAPKTSQGFPDLPSLGIPSVPPPPMGLPSPPPPPAPSRAPKAPSAKFGEVDPGELAGLEVPVVAPTAPEEAPPLSEEDAAAREAELKARYAKEFGRSTSTAPSVPSAVPGPKSILPKIVGIVALALAVLGTGAFFAIRFFAPEEPKGPGGPEVPVVKKLTPEEVQAKVDDLLSQARAKVSEGLPEKARPLYDDAVKQAVEGQVASTGPAFDEVRQLIDVEARYRSALERAVRNFCREDYTRPTLDAFKSLEKERPSDPAPARFIDQLYYNSGVQTLQAKQPWEAIWSFDQLLERNANDVEARRLREFSTKYQPGSAMGEDYERFVDRLPFRRHGCST